MRLRIALARTGALVFTALLTVTLLTAERTPANAATDTAPRPVAVAAAVVPAAEVFDLLIEPTLSAPEAVVAVLGVEAAPQAAVAEPEPEPVAVPAPAPPPPVVAGGSYVLASWYGPGFYGNRTACGQIYSPQIMGVAHKTLPCGTLLVLSYGGGSVTVPVIDRGPYIAGRTLDLSNATKIALGCTDLCTVLMQYAR